MCVDPEQSERRLKRRKRNRKFRRLAQHPRVAIRRSLRRIGLPDPRPRLLAYVAQLDIADEIIGIAAEPYNPFERDDFDDRAISVLHTRRIGGNPAKTYESQRLHQEQLLLKLAAA